MFSLTLVVEDAEEVVADAVELDEAADAEDELEAEDAPLVSEVVWLCKLASSLARLSCRLDPDPAAVRLSDDMEISFHKRQFLH